MSFRPTPSFLRRALAAALGTLAIAMPASSQTSCGPLSLVVSPDPAPFGMPITVTATNTGTAPIYFSSSCVFSGIHQGTPSGPLVRRFGCDQMGSSIQPNASRSFVWSQQDDFGAQVAPGVYHIGAYWPTPCSISLRIDGCVPGSVVEYGQACGTLPCLAAYTPRIQAATCPQVGSTFRIALTGFACTPVGPGPTAFLWIGSSRTQWAGTSLPLVLPGGCNLETSVEVAISAASFLGRSGFEIPIPALAFLSGQTVHLQGAQLDTVSPVTRLVTSNALQVVIQ